jgi:superfamily II DNA helicase RecQ
MTRMMMMMSADVTGDQKGMMYCRSKQACERLAEKLGCNFYHAGMVGRKETRWEIFRRWATGAGRHRWIVATTALGTGIDVRGIVGIVHMKQPYGLVDFVQQTGRGERRERKMMESVIMMDERKA